ncbi:hypothetical protein C0J52_25363 [Blattella germanica]|nr:hypothetical protein C0J52_25363 [Blattella germanica]
MHYSDSYHPSFSQKNIKLEINKTVILPVILYGCETWTLTLREEKRLRVFENKTGEWGRLHNTELNDLYRRRILEGKPEGKRPVGGPRMKWENNIILDLRQDRDVWRAYVRTAMNLRVR